MASSGSVRRLLVTAIIVPISAIPVTLMMEAVRSSETPVLTIVTRRNIQEDGILHSHRRDVLQVLHSFNWLGTVAEKCVSCEVRTGFLYPRNGHSSFKSEFRPYAMLSYSRRFLDFAGSINIMSVGNRVHSR
jgi:hypothetical protein